MSGTIASTPETQTAKDLASTSPKNQLTRSAALVVLQQLIYDHCQNAITYNIQLPEHPLAPLAKGNTPGMLVFIPGVITDENNNFVDLLISDSL